jgi:hypothetical protein
MRMVLKVINIYVIAPITYKNKHKLCHNAMEWYNPLWMSILRPIHMIDKYNNTIVVTRLKNILNSRLKVTI